MHNICTCLARCHEARIRIHVITGCHTAIAATVHIGEGHPQMAPTATLERLPEDDHDRLLRQPGELVFARANPVTKPRIAETLPALALGREPFAHQC